MCKQCVSRAEGEFKVNPKKSIKKVAQRQDFRWLLPLIALAIIAAMVQAGLRINNAQADSVARGPTREDARVVAITFSSAWCGPCRILKPRLAAVKPDFAEQGVRFLEFDSTFGNMGQLRAEAQQENLLNIYEQFSPATGFTVLVSGRNGEVLDILTADYSKSAIRASLSRALVMAETARSGRAVSEPGFAIPQ